MDKQVNRREFLQSSVMAGAGLAITPTLEAGAPAYTGRRPNDKLRLGFIGTGLRGQGHVRLALDRDDCEVVAVCDIDEEMMKRTLAVFDKLSKPKPTVYLGDEHHYREMLEKETLDAVIIATPWRWHTEMAVAAMEKGIYTGVEVCGAFSLEECWQLVDTHEKTGAHLFFLENVCYRRDVMAILNMVRQNMFGELIHLEGGYQHDLRNIKFNGARDQYESGVKFGEEAFSEARWRTWHSVYRNGELYPTHGIGPVAQYLNIHRGNRFVFLTSIASKARGLRNYVADHPKGGPDHPNAKIDYRLGDVVTTSIQCANGETVVLRHDTNLPRPYSLGFRVQGTKGIWMDVNDSIYLEGRSEKSHRWEPAGPYLKQYDHPLWKRYEDRATGAGHGGMDFFLLHAFVESARQGLAAPFDAYDAAAWLAITPLSEQSIASGSQPVAFPDFTRGRWMEKKVSFALDDSF